MPYEDGNVKSLITQQSIIAVDHAYYTGAAIGNSLVGICQSLQMSSTQTLNLPVSIIMIV